MVNPSPPPSFYQADNYRTEESIGLMMRQILTSLAQGVEQKLANTALTHAQWMPVFKLHLGHASTVAELARECHLDAGAMTRMLDRLEAKGLCTRSRSETDRRVVNIALTPAGSQAATEIPAVLCEVLNGHLNGLSADEFATLKSLLQRVLQNTKGGAADNPGTPATTSFLPPLPGATDAR
jgi:DNA-binding MarR family transcriptional regulator